MKKALFIIAAILLDTLLFAGPVSREKALQVADKVFRSMPETKGAAPALQIVWDGEFEQTKGNVDPAFYVVTREGGGFVIVAGNDDVQPVLGFSFENPFVVEGMPAHVRAWMEQIKAYVRSGVAPTPEVKEKWGDFVETKSALPINYITDEFDGYSRTGKWGQDAPLNQFAPVVHGQQGQAVTGCVPLALAEIMAWFGNQNRASGEGTVEGYSYYVDYGGDAQGKNTISEHQLETVYNWEALNSCKENTDFNSVIGTNAAHLIYDIGTILQVKYNDAKAPGAGTGGNLEYLDRLTTMLYYNKGARELYSSNYSSGKWLSMLIEEIRKHPVYCSGLGHAFVADGYATYAGDQVIHYNLGWWGSCNGYYQADLLNTDNGFYETLTALFDFYPDPEGTSEGRTEISFFYEADYNCGLTSMEKSGSQTILEYCSVTNTGSIEFSGKLALFKVDKNGNRGNKLWEINISSLPVLGYYDFYNQYAIQFSTPSNLSFGDKYVLFYKKDGSSEEYLPVVNERKDKVLSEAAVYPTAFIKTKASYSVGDAFVFELTNHDYKYGNDSTFWTVTDPDGEESTYSQDDYHVLLDKAGEYKIAVSTELPDTYEVETIVTYITVSE